MNNTITKSKTNIHDFKVQPLGYNTKISAIYNEIKELNILSIEPALNMFKMIARVNRIRLIMSQPIKR